MSFPGFFNYLFADIGTLKARTPPCMRQCSLLINDPENIRLCNANNMRRSFGRTNNMRYYV